MMGQGLGMFPEDGASYVGSVWLFGLEQRQRVPV